MSEEKKLTDEEIVKALECCIKGVTVSNCAECPLDMIEEDCCYYTPTLIDRYALDLIHRLQSENERLTEENGQLKGYNSGLEYEIERLTEENKNLLIKVWNYERPARTPLYSSESMVNCNLVTCYNENADLKSKNAELQKQVDELETTNGQAMAYIEGLEYELKQTVKDTAKEIFAELFYMASMRHSDVANILAWAKEKAKSKGVEVE